MMDLAIKDIRHRPRRFILTCIGIGMLLMVVMAMGGIYRGLVDDATLMVEKTGADVWVVQKDTNGPIAESSRIPEDLKHTLRALPGVEDTGALSYQTVQIDWKSNPKRLFVIGYDKNLGLGGPSDIIAGRPILKRHFETVASVKSGLKIGEVLSLGQDDYTVVGLTRSMVSPSGDPVIYLTLADAQKVQFQKNNEAIRNERERLKEQVAAILPENVDEGRIAGALANDTHIVNTVVLKVKKGYPVKDVVSSIENWKHYRAFTVAEQENILTMGMIEKSKKQLGLFRIILLIVSMAIINLVIYTQTLDKIREIATLKLIGAPDWAIVRLIVEQSLLLGFFAYWIGYLLISLTYAYFPRRILLVTLDMKMLFVVVMFICVMASFTGVRSALKVDPGNALGG
jgi:putative ABC transport system permease protein